MTAVITTLCIAATAQAQTTQASIDIGATRVRYDDAVTNSAYTLSPWLLLQGRGLALDASATASQFSGASWSTNGGVALSARTPARHRMSLDLSVFAGGSIRHNDVHTGELRGSASAQFDAGYFGGALGAGTGRTWDGFTQNTLLFGQGNIWAQRGPLSIQASVTPSSIRNGPRFTDAELDASLNGRRIDLNASFGVRTGNDSLFGSRTRTWGGATATFWITPVVGLVTSAGTYPASLAQALPGGRYVSMALRFARPNKKNDNSATPNPDDRSVAIPPAVTITKGRNNKYVFRIRVRERARQARSVELLSDVTQWQATSLTRSRTDGLWEIALPVRPGPHQLNIRIDGGQWIVPDGMPAISDEFNGSVALFEVP